MNDWQLPPELESLERELAARLTPDPSAELRLRITGGVYTQLRRERRQESWRFAIAVAIVVGVWINLSFSAVQHTDFLFKANKETPPVEQTAQQIQNLLPDMSESDAQHEALLLCSSSNLLMYPRIDIPPTAINQILNFNGSMP
ncbi:MAG TPA: hypothetical protein VIH42_05550 [Thermoguttaceae bacterium]